MGIKINNNVVRWALYVLMGVSFILSSFETAKAQDPVTEAIRQGVIKVIKAIDLQVQRMQTKTIWLQNAQKVVENKMSELKLNQISDWVEKQRTLYANYFDELSKVKSIISYYHRIKEISQMQLALVEEYKRTFRLFKLDNNYSKVEIEYMGKVYEGIIDESVKNLDQVFLIIKSFSTQMADAKRLELIDAAADAIERCYADLKAFNSENIVLSLQRAKDSRDIERVKTLYGIR